jgi:hypothetical protein
LALRDVRVPEEIPNCTKALVQASEFLAEVCALQYCVSRAAEYTDWAREISYVKKMLREKKFPPSILGRVDRLFDFAEEK